MMEYRINTISLQYYVQKTLSIDIYRTLLGHLSHFVLQLLSLVLIFGDLSLCPIQESHPPLLTGRVVTAPFVLMSALLPQLHSTVL